MAQGRHCLEGLRKELASLRETRAGATIEEVLADYPYPEREDILQALRHAAWRS